jgi:aryl-alcohol dehydrogenase-like predicted oxidoreductase
MKEVVNMKKRKLRNLEVSAIGMGCMGFNHGYGAAPSQNEAIYLIQQAYDLGCDFFDTAEGYDKGNNEKLVGEALKTLRNKIVLATKFRIPDDEASSRKLALKSIREHLEASLKRLETDRIDLYYQHRVNKNIPVEEVAYCMGQLIKEGKILSWGQSQSTADEIKRAHAVTPLTAVQSEYSIMERMFEKDVIPLCKELGIGFVPFAPLASGFLSGKYNSGNKYEGDDVRRVITRFQPENINANQPLLDLLHKFAQEKNVTPAQLSLAWVLHKGEFIVPIPGMRTLDRIKENLEAANIIFSQDEYNQIEEELAKIEIYGNRTDEDIAKLYK